MNYTDNNVGTDGKLSYNHNVVVVVVDANGSDCGWKWITQLSYWA